ncbi:unnamed protein product [Schistosoma curassoni]|uniref:ICA69 domain-containing protein n=1 Tax=Schistosoma curassoni TaxID=6186 RepID=A0A183KEI2_9TREM|nr:unnamed protein product [Schistosoma curassoni]
MDNLFGPSEDQSENQYPDIQKLIFNEISSSQTLSPSTLASNTANNLLWEYFLNRLQDPNNSLLSKSPSLGTSTITTNSLQNSTNNSNNSCSNDLINHPDLLNFTNLTNPNDQMTKLSQSDLIHNYIKKFQSFGNDLNCANNDSDSNNDNNNNNNITQQMMQYYALCAFVQTTTLLSNSSSSTST